MTRPKNVQDIKIEHIPEGMPCLKWKRGLYYRPKNSGYTNSLLEAGFYPREEAISYCFSTRDGEPTPVNGSCGVFAMPLWMAIEQNYMTTSKVAAIRERLREIEKYLTPENDAVETTIF